ncbi:MAG: 2Fe-2S iron-sulfur cluster-binding protein [Anaplasmataceae bacterium]|nr:2Fe-2S iron-sulfur cluster-binding protein [Anaplasmataceae bacterium]
MDKSEVFIDFVLPDGETKKCHGKIGQSVMTIAKENHIDELEGSCEESLACSTCHVIVDTDWYEKTVRLSYKQNPRLTYEDDEDSEILSDEEEGLLDLAYGVCARSRLGCQIIMTEELNGLKVFLPSANRNSKVKSD